MAELDLYAAPRPKARSGRIDEGQAAQFVFGVLLAVGTYAAPQVVAPYSNRLSEALALLLVSLATWGTLRLSKWQFVSFWAVLIVLQNATAGAWYAGGGAPTSVVVTEEKTIALVVAALISWREIAEFVSRRELRPAVALFAFVIAINARHFDSNGAAYLRNFAGPILAIMLFGAFAASSDRDARLRYLHKLAAGLACLLALGDVIELCVGTPSWRLFVHAAELPDIGSPSVNTTLFGLTISRVGGFIVEPPDSGYAAAVVLAMLVLSYKLARERGLDLPRPTGSCLVAGFALLATAAKDGVLMLLLLSLAFALHGREVNLKRAFFVTAAVALVLVALYIGYEKGFGELISSVANPSVLLGGTSTTYHFAGLEYGVIGALANPLGHGIGVGGNFALYGGEPAATWLGSGSESGWGVLLYQIGLIGFGAWVWVLMSYSRLAGRYSGAVVIAWATSAMFAESELGIPIAGFSILLATMVAEQLPQRR